MQEAKVPPEAPNEAGSGHTPLPRPPDTATTHPATERLGVLEAMRWHWGLVLVPVVLFLGAAICVGLIRSPVYTATANLTVDFGAENPSALPGSVSAAQALADSYSRSIQA